MNLTKNFGIFIVSITIEIKMQKKKFFIMAI